MLTESVYVHNSSDVCECACACMLNQKTFYVIFFLLLSSYHVLCFILLLFHLTCFVSNSSRSIIQSNPARNKKNDPNEMLNESKCTYEGTIYDLPSASMLCLVKYMYSIASIIFKATMNNLLLIICLVRVFFYSLYLLWLLLPSSFVLATLFY